MYRGICSTDQWIKNLIQPLIPALANGYAELYKEQKNFETLKKCGKEEFFGLRDYYRYCKTLRYDFFKFQVLRSCCCFQLYFVTKIYHFFCRVNIEVSLRWFMLSPLNLAKSLVGMSLNTLSGGILEG